MVVFLMLMNIMERMGVIIRIFARCATQKLQNHEKARMIIAPPTAVNCDTVDITNAFGMMRW